MNEENNRWMAWRPDAPGFSRDDTIFAIGVQCRVKQFTVTDVLKWLGLPHKASGNTVEGKLAYLYSDPAEDVFPLFWLKEGRIVGFGGVSRYRNNSTRIDQDTGEEVHFNMLDEMEPFKETAFT